MARADASHIVATSGELVRDLTAIAGTTPPYRCYCLGFHLMISATCSAALAHMGYDICLYPRYLIVLYALLSGCIYYKRVLVFHERAFRLRFERFFIFLNRSLLFFFFFFNDTATTEIYTLSLHDALPI